jgi:acyl-CoA dehydrogenase
VELDLPDDLKMLREMVRRFVDQYLVKLFCTEMAWQAADMCLQVYGGIGLTTDLPVERLLRDQRSHMITEGTAEIMRMALARYVLNTFG